MAVKPRNKELNRRDVLSYLKRAFTRALQLHPTLVSQKATRTVTSNGTVVKTNRYELEIEFAYLINEIQRAPTYIVPKYITDANELITKIEQASVVSTVVVI